MKSGRAGEFDIFLSRKVAGLNNVYAGYYVYPVTGETTQTIPLSSLNGFDGFCSCVRIGALTASNSITV